MNGQNLSDQSKHQPWTGTNHCDDLNDGDDESDNDNEDADDDDDDDDDVDDDDDRMIVEGWPVHLPAGCISLTFYPVSPSSFLFIWIF